MLTMTEGVCRIKFHHNSLPGRVHTINYHWQVRSSSGKCALDHTIKYEWQVLLVAEQERSPARALPSLLCAGVPRS